MLTQSTIGLVDSESLAKGMSQIQFRCKRQQRPLVWPVTYRAYAWTPSKNSKEWNSDNSDSQRLRHNQPTWIEKSSRTHWAVIPQRVHRSNRNKDQISCCRGRRQVHPPRPNQPLTGVNLLQGGKYTSHNQFALYSTSMQVLRGAELRGTENSTIQSYKSTSRINRYGGSGIPGESKGRKWMS